MSDFLPRQFPADVIPAVTSAAVTAGQVVAVSGNNTVAATSAASAAVVGVAGQDDLIGGNQITVYRTGIHVLTASGAIAAGDPVISAASGAVATISTDTVYSHVIGTALSAAASGKVTVALRIS